MKSDLFYQLFYAALKSENMDEFVAENGAGGKMERECDMDTAIDQMREIWLMAHMTVADLRKTTGLSQTKFGLRFCIPQRTIEGWERGKCECKPYIRLMMAEILGLVNITVE